MRINRQIRLPRVFLIDDQGEAIGEIDTADAIARAESAGLDLVEVSPNERPPVCKILDYGKHKYRQKKKQATQKSHQAKLKEVRVQPRTDEHDLQVRLKQANKFLEHGDKVLVSCRFKGREITHKEFGFRLMDRFRDELKMICKVEKDASMEGRRMTMMLAPLTLEQKKKLQKEADEAAKKASGDSQRKRRVITLAEQSEGSKPAENEAETSDA
ncbi:MAG: translation initiation factor IF-3 [Planctomycetes bacterium]|nr:translation initiation factor IF-3 [Planctomycetota bacterium]